MTPEPVQPPSNAVSSDDPETIPYQGIKYERSKVVFARVPLFEYLSERGLKLDTQLVQLVEALPAGTFIAGGSVAHAVMPTSLLPTATRGARWPKDIDLFFANETAYEAACKMLAFAYREMKGSRVPEGVRMFEPALAGLLNVQAINIGWFPEGVDSVLDSFDFTVTHFGIDVFSKELVFNPTAPLDYARDLLLNHRMEGDAASAKRIKKYIAKGFVPVGITRCRAIELGLVPSNQDTQQ